MAQQQSSDGICQGTEVINKTMQNFKTKIGKAYSTKDVIKTWDCISKWIDNNLSQDKGILIKGIGYFTFSQWNTNASQNDLHMIKEPVFVIDEKLAKDFNLERKRPYNSGKIRERYLNVNTVAQEFRLNVEMVTHCFKEVVTSFRNLLYSEKNCELPFPKIGKLQIKNKKISMKFYKEFLDKHNNTSKNGYEKKIADQFKIQGRPNSASSIISRPASALSNYRPNTGFCGVLPGSDGSIDRPMSSLSVDVQNRPTSSFNANKDLTKPVSKLSERPNSASSIISRPASALSNYRPKTGFCGVLPGSDGNVDRPMSSLSVDVQNRPMSSNNANEDLTKPMSKLTERPNSASSIISRPASTLSNYRPNTGFCGVLPVSDGNIDRPMSSLSVGVKNRPASSINANKDLTKPMSRNVLPNSDLQTARPKSNMSTWEQICKNLDTMCSPCKIMENRINQTNISKPEEYSNENKDKLMKGENPINRLLSMENINKRKSVQKEISKYNYVQARKIEDINNNEKSKMRNDKNFGNVIFNKRPSSISNNYDKIMDLKRSLLNQIHGNTMKKEKDTIKTLEKEKLIQKELLKSLYEETIRSIEAKNQKKKNYSIMLDEHMKNKIKMNDNTLNKDKITPTKNTILCPSESRDGTKSRKDKNRKLAEYQQTQITTKNLMSKVEKKKNIELEQKLLKQIQEEEKKERENAYQKKSDWRKDLYNEQTGRKNIVPNSYPMNFPLKKIGDKCRRCKKNRPGLLLEKITDLP